MSNTNKIMVPLQLPKASLKIRRTHHSGLQVWDPTRKKWLVLTPEEWVRMHVMYYFHLSYSIPLSRIQSEFSFQINNKIQRCDLIILSKDLKPDVLIECKSPEVTINDGVKDQISAYNYHIGARYLMITNGVTHEFFMFDEQGQVIQIHENDLSN